MAVYLQIQSGYYAVFSTILEFWVLKLWLFMRTKLCTLVLGICQMPI